MKGYEVISMLKDYLSEEDIIVSSNGNISREVFHLLPQPQMYLRGAMGLPVAVGLGLALANPSRKVIVITGDGNFLMGLNSMVTASYYQPSNLKIIILDNLSYFTTGGQETTSSGLDYPSFFHALNTTSHQAFVAHERIGKNLELFLNADGFRIICLYIDKGKMSLENIPWHPKEIAQKIMKKLSNERYSHDI